MKTMTLVSILALIFSGAAFAAEHEMEKGAQTEVDKLFNELDADQNDLIDISEAEDNSLVLRDFAKIDKDGSNELDRAEFSAYEPLQQFEPPTPEEPEPGAAPLLD